MLDAAAGLDCCALWCGSVARSGAVEQSVDDECGEGVQVLRAGVAFEDRRPAEDAAAKSA
jgi:hypothetical protein